MPAPLVIIPLAAVIAYESVVVPRETPLGVIDGCAMEIRFCGRRYQFLDTEAGDEDDGEEDDSLAIDLEDGSVVRLRHERREGDDV